MIQCVYKPSTRRFPNPWYLAVQPQEGAVDQCLAMITVVILGPRMSETLASKIWALLWNSFRTPGLPFLLVCTVFHYSSSVDHPACHGPSQALPLSSSWPLSLVQLSL